MEGSVRSIDAAYAIRECERRWLMKYEPIREEEQMLKPCLIALYLLSMLAGAAWHWHTAFTGSPDLPFLHFDGGRIQLGSNPNPDKATLNPTINFND